MKKACNKCGKLVDEREYNNVGHGIIDLSGLCYHCAVEKAMKHPRKIMDIADMPKFNVEIKDGIHSVSEGKIIYTENNFVTCKEHGACLAVNKDTTIWRCPTCHEGAYVEWWKNKS